MVDRMDKRKPVKLTRSEKKAMRRTEKLAVKLEKEQERADKIRRKKEAKRAAREEKRRKKGSRKSGLQRKDRKPTPNKRIEKKHSYSEQKSSTGKVRCTNVKRKQERNISAQNSIPYREMAKDGICRVQEKYYSKTIRFYDINYQLAQNEDKNAIFENWCDFLNYFDSTIHFQISFINHHSNMKEFESVIQIQPQNDAFDDVRMEYAQMLRDQLAKGNNGLVRTKYITFGIEAENIREAKPKLERIEADILNNFKVLGVSAYPLNGEERLQILYETFNPEEKVPFQFSYDRILRSGMGTKDFVAPTSFVFKEGKTFQMGNTIGAASYLQILAPELTDKMLAEFLDMNRNLIVNLHIQSIDQMKAIKLVKNKVTDINRMKIEEQKKAVRAGYDMDIIPSDLNTYGGEAKRLLEDLQSRNERMFLVTVLFLNTAKTKQELDNAVFQTAGIAQKYNCSLRRLDYLQEQGLMSSVPLGMNMIPIKRALTTTSTAIFVPFTTQELFMGGESLYYGLNALSNNMIMVDRKKLKNPNGLILGTPGCFTGETKLLLPDGRKVSFLELFAEKEEVFVNSFDFQKQELVKARGYDVRCTKEVTELVEVELENGEIVRCTPDHWFLTQSAGYVEACNLKVGAKFIPEHEVKAVRFLSLEEAVPVYDISVEGYQNFLLSCGVVVHNSGKSFAAKREIANVFFATQDDIIIGDPEGEYYPLVHALGGQVIHISPTSHDYINPMDINLDYSDDDNPLGFKSDFILSLCELIMGSRNGIEAEEKSVIDRCLPLVYQKYFENPTPENMPVLGDLYDCLRKQEEVQAQRIATALEIYVNGSLNVFNHHTNVELNNRIVCFDIKDLGKQLKKLGMLIVQDQVWNRVTVNRVAHKSTRYYIDEFHLLLKEEQTAAYSVEIWKRFRKWGGKQNRILKILQRSIVYAVLIEAEGNN
jgi:hypothetical protein